MHSRHLRRCREEVVPNYASRDITKAKLFCQRYGGLRSYGNYRAVIDDPEIDAVAIAVPPNLHLELTLQPLNSGKHVLVEKQAYLTLADYEAVRACETAPNKSSSSVRTTTTNRSQSAFGASYGRV